MVASCAGVDAIIIAGNGLLSTRLLKLGSQEARSIDLDRLVRRTCWTEECSDKGRSRNVYCTGVQEARDGAERQPKRRDSMSLGIRPRTCRPNSRPRRPDPTFLVNPTN